MFNSNEIIVKTINIKIFQNVEFLLILHQKFFDITIIS